MIRGKTTSGFEFEVKKEALDNMELVDLLAEGADNPVVVSKIMKMILGEDQKQRLYAHLRVEDGRVPLAAVEQAVEEIIQAFGDQGKN